MKKVLSIILLLMLLVGCGTSTNGNVTGYTSSNDNKDYSELVSVVSVDVLSKKWGNGDTVDIVTTVQNNSDSIVNYIEIQIDYLDESGNTLNSATKISLTPIEPNAKQEILFPEKKENIIKVSSKVIDVRLE